MSFSHIVRVALAVDSLLILSACAEDKVFRYSAFASNGVLIASGTIAFNDWPLRGKTINGRKNIKFAAKHPNPTAQFGTHAGRKALNAKINGNQLVIELNPRGIDREVICEAPAV